MGNWTQIACWHFLLVASDRLNEVGVRVIIIVIVEGRLNCLYLSIEALEDRVEVEEFFVKSG